MTPVRAKQALLSVDSPQLTGRDVRLNLTDQGYYAQLIAQLRQNVIDGFGGCRRSRIHSETKVRGCRGALPGLQRHWCRACEAASARP
jgi:hypothetical protein